MAQRKGSSRKKEKRFAAGAAGPGEQLVDWLAGKGVPGVVVLALICICVLCLLVWFVVFSDFSASADFVYNQF